MTEAVEIRSGPARVVATGVVASYLGNPIEVTLGVPFSGFHVIFAFNDVLGGAPQYQLYALAASTVQITLNNFVAPLAVGTVDPVVLATNGIDDLLVSFSVTSRSPTNTNKTLQFSFYAVSRSPA
jgi:hypothetical protein